jgi:hypothetical protein
LSHVLLVKPLFTLGNELKYVCYARKKMRHSWSTTFEQLVFIVLWPTPLQISKLNTQTMHIKAIMYLYKTPLRWSPLKCYIYPDGIRTRVFWSWGWCDAHCATPHRANFQTVIVKAIERSRIVAMSCDRDNNIRF